MPSWFNQLFTGSGVNQRGPADLKGGTGYSTNSNAIVPRECKDFVAEGKEMKWRQEEERWWRKQKRAAEGGRGGGYNERQDPTDRREYEDDCEFDDFGRKKKKTVASSEPSAASHDRQDRMQAALERLRQKSRTQDTSAASAEGAQERWDGWEEKIEGVNFYVGGFVKSVSEQDLLEHFSKYGEVIQAEVKREYETGISRGFGFVVMSGPKALNRQVLAQSHIIKGREVTVKLHQSQDMVKLKKSRLLETPEAPEAPAHIVTALNSSEGFISWDSIDSDKRSSPEMPVNLATALHSAEGFVSWDSIDSENARGTAIGPTVEEPAQSSADFSAPCSAQDVINFLKQQRAMTQSRS